MTDKKISEEAKKLKQGDKEAAKKMGSKGGSHSHSGGRGKKIDNQDDE
ncbi:MAG: hypothetical protein J0H68_03290 [Sphingobacteriia bacterium]|nr:hypothetical protein [Sphingobacteriia bacterium]